VRLTRRPADAARVSVLQNGGGAVSVDNSGGVMRFVNCTFQNSRAVRLHAARAFCATDLVKEDER
jgi:hypothetical protein